MLLCQPFNINSDGPNLLSMPITLIESCSVSSPLPLCLWVSEPQFQPGGPEADPSSITQPVPAIHLLCVTDMYQPL